MTKALRIGIAGAGSVALGTAALLFKNKHIPTVWSPSGASASELKHTPLHAHGAIEAEFKVGVAASAQDLADNADALILALPTNGHKMVMDALSPHIRNGQHVLISSHASFGALYLAQALRARGVSAPITAWGTTIVSGRRNGADMRVTTVRDSVDMCTVPDAQTEAGLDLCETLFGQRFKPRDGLLAATLSNLNPQNHLGIALCNFTRMEHGEAWSQALNVTPKVGRLLEKLDLERLAIAKALGLDVKTIFEHFHQSFHVPAASVSEMNKNMHAHGYGGAGPNTPDSRYVTEDVPYGLHVTALLGRLVGQPAILHEAGIALFSAMYDRDFATENDLLDALDLTRFRLEDLQRAAHTGLLQTNPTEL